MNIIFNKRSYQDKLEATTSVFQKALTDAKNLMTEMQDEVAANVEAISALRERNEQINKV